MPQQQPGEQGSGYLSYGNALSYAYGAAYGLAALSEPFTATNFGKRYLGMNVGFGGILLLGFIMVSPGHEQALIRFGGVWLAMVAIQSAMAHWNHNFGRRQVTGFCGIPVLCKLLPFGLHFSRRVLTPLAVFAIGSLVGDRPLSLLIKSSAIGQAIAFGFIYAIKAADDDAKSDAMLTLRNR